jgi:hypothetical protein
VLLMEALRPSLERAGGRIVLISSVAALHGSGGGPYGAMKALLGPDGGWMTGQILSPNGGVARGR